MEMHVAGQKSYLLGVREKAANKFSDLMAKKEGRGLETFRRLECETRGRLLDRLGLKSTIFGQGGKR